MRGHPNVHTRINSISPFQAQWCQMVTLQSIQRDIGLADLF